MKDEQFTILLAVMDEILGELKRRDTAQTAKVEIKTSTRGTDIVVVAYQGNTAAELEQAGNAAAREYRRVMTVLTNDILANMTSEANRAR